MTHPLKASNSAATMDTASAGQYAVYVDITAEQNADPNSMTGWAEVRGIQSFAPKYAQVTEDNTDLGSDGWMSEYPTGNGFTAAIKGQVRVSRETGAAVDAGVQKLLDAGKQKGKDGIVHMKHWRSDSVKDQGEYRATCEASLDEGKPPKLQDWSASLKAMGEPNQDFVVPTQTTASDDYAVSVGTATGGTFTLTYKGKTTATIAYNANAAAVKTALVALDDGYDASSWTVTGSGSTVDPYVIATPGGAITGSGTSLTGGTLTVTPA